MCGCRKAKLLAGTRGISVPVVTREPEIDIPSTAVWGPLLWKILHITAHKSGKNANEGRIWKNIFKLLKHIIPCSECKMHYTTYVNMTDFKVIGTGTPTFRVYISEWLHTFHNAVNARIGKELAASVIDYSALTVDDYIAGFESLVPIFVNAGLLTAANWNIFKYNIMKIN